MTKLNNWDDEHSEELFIEGIKLARTFRKDKSSRRKNQRA